MHCISALGTCHRPPLQEHIWLGHDHVFAVICSSSLGNRHASSAHLFHCLACVPWAGRDAQYVVEQDVAQQNGTQCQMCSRNWPASGCIDRQEDCCQVQTGHAKDQRQASADIDRPSIDHGEVCDRQGALQRCIKPAQCQQAEVCIAVTCWPDCCECAVQGCASGEGQDSHTGQRELR